MTWVSAVDISLQKFKFVLCEETGSKSTTVLNQLKGPEVHDILSWNVYANLCKLIVTLLDFVSVTLLICACHPTHEQ